MSASTQARYHAVWCNGCGEPIDSGHPTKCMACVDKSSALDAAINDATAQRLMAIADRMDATARRMIDSLAWSRSAFDRLDARELADAAATVRGVALVLRMTTERAS